MLQNTESEAKKFAEGGDVIWRFILHKPLPYVAAIVTLEEGINMPTRIIGVDPEPENFTIGMDLVVDFIDADGQNLPVFRPA